MAKKFSMTWNAKSRRWFKKFDGKQYTVKASVLAEQFPDLVSEQTKLGSFRAANAWWESKLEEIDPPCRLEMLADAVDDANRRFRDLVDVEQMGKTEGELHFALMNQAIIGNGLKPLTPKSKDRPIVKFVESWLAGKPESGRGVLRSQIFVWVDNCGLGSVDEITSQAVEDYAAWLKSNYDWEGKQKTSVSNLWAAFRGFCNYIDSLEIVLGDGLVWGMPKRFKAIKFRRAEPKVDYPSVKWVREFLEAADDRRKAWVLVMLNLGCTQTEVAHLTADQIDLKKGYATIKRHKQRHSAGTPTVKYKLWDSTIAAIKKHGNKKGLVFTNLNGNILEQQSPRIQTLSKWWRDHIAKCELKKYTPKSIRKLTRNLIEESPHSKYAKWFAGHSINGVDKSYVKPNTPAKQKAFDAAVLWLGEELLG